MLKNITVTALTIYPVKSLAGISLDSSDLDSMGLAYDRRWMLVDENGGFLTQRTVPQMALIQTALQDGQLTLSIAGKAPHRVAEVTEDAASIEVSIWNDRVLASKVGKASDDWLSGVLGVDCQLVFMPEETLRQCDPEFAKQGERTGFADGFPMLLISEASLDDLNSRLLQPVDMRRFRPNIVVSGCEAFAEDQWNQFSIGDIQMRGVKLCSRCPLPNVDPDKGERISNEPIATLMKYRKWDHKVFFGMNVIHEKQGRVSVGDELIVDTSNL